MPAPEGVALMAQIMDEVEDEYSGFARHSNFTERMNVWREVVFTVAKRDPRLNFREKLKEYFHPTVKPYVVWNPVWQTVPIPLQAQLVAIDPVGLV